MNGAARDLSIESSSGYGALDQVALGSVSKTGLTPQSMVTAAHWSRLCQFRFTSNWSDRDLTQQPSTKSGPASRENLR